ncbi:hypothetical protein ACUOEB_004294, partial [Vibrio vulnificus]
MSNATTKLNHTTVDTKPNDGMKNAKRWESLLNALLYACLSEKRNQIITIVNTFFCVLHTQ